jgi:UDP-N-acetylglucosamine transferase subunit ALG13
MAAPGKTGRAGILGSGALIFVTIGSALPFDRLVQAMDDWARDNPGEDILAQTGDGVFEPQHMRWVRSLSREDYAAAMEAADLIVAHAGVGSVVTAGEYARPVVLLPRRGALGEHRNDHQADTAGWLRDRPGIYVADDETELAERIAAARRADASTSLPMSKTAPPEFLEKLRKFVLE